MIKKVVLSNTVKKQLAKLPVYIADKLQDWIDSVEKESLEMVRKIRGYHDEPLKGKLKGYYSIRLNKGYRAYYRIIHDRILFVLVERIDKHEY
ncbi:MAG: type II toxin-antitoxin system mRNA interferase toxin, RelE/StbE family [Bdellovibrionota bacterium]